MTKKERQQLLAILRRMERHSQACWGTPRMDAQAADACRIQDQLAAVLKIETLRAKRLTKRQLDARVEAFNEAADHLDQDWTEDKEERRQGLLVSELLRTMSDDLGLKTARELKHTPPAELLLCLSYRIAGPGTTGVERSTRYQEVLAHVGDELHPPLTRDEMSAIMFEAKMEFVRRIRARKRTRKAKATQ